MALNPFSKRTISLLDMEVINFYDSLKPVCCSQCTKLIADIYPNDSKQPHLSRYISLAYYFDEYIKGEKRVSNAIYAAR